MTKMQREKVHDAHLSLGGGLQKRRVSSRQRPGLRNGLQGPTCKVTMACAVDVALQPRLGICHSKPSSLSKEASCYVVSPLHLLASGRAAYSNASRPAWRLTCWSILGGCLFLLHVSSGGGQGSTRRWSHQARGETGVGGALGQQRAALRLGVVWFQAGAWWFVSASVGRVGRGRVGRIVSAAGGRWLTSSPAARIVAMAIILPLSRGDDASLDALTLPVSG